MRPVRRDFGAQDARIGRRTCAIIVGSRCASLKLGSHQNFERSVHSARKIYKSLHENRTRLHRFLQSFCAQHALSEFTKLVEVISDVLEMICGIIAVSE